MQISRFGLAVAVQLTVRIAPDDVESGASPIRTPRLDTAQMLNGWVRTELGLDAGKAGEHPDIAEIGKCSAP